MKQLSARIRVCSRCQKQTKTNEWENTMLSRFAFVLMLAAAMTANAGAQQSASSVPSIEIPLTLQEDTYYETYQPKLQVGVGSLQLLSMVLDTGSDGLVLFAIPGIPGNGTSCSSEPATVSYGNPKRVTYSGVVCTGPISIGGIVSTPPIQFALMTSTTYCETGFHCKTPQENYEDGVYGIFGAGIAPGIDRANPLRALQGPYGKRFMLRLNPASGAENSLILAPAWRYDAAIFPQFEESIGAQNLPDYDKGRACVILNNQQTSVCPLVSFDTGNGVPFFYAPIPGLKTVAVNGSTYVAPGTTIGFAPRLGGPAAFTLTATDNFAGEFRYVDLSIGLINVSIQAFFGNDVIFDGEQGVITIAPTRSE
jgi:hypothetical protein